MKGKRKKFVTHWHPDWEKMYFSLSNWHHHYFLFSRNWYIIKSTKNWFGRYWDPFFFPHESVILKITMKGLGTVGEGRTEQEKANQLPRTHLRQKPIRAKVLETQRGKWCFTDLGNCSTWVNTAVLVKHISPKDFLFADFCLFSLFVWCAHIYE